MRQLRNHHSRLMYCYQKPLPLQNRHLLQSHNLAHWLCRSRHYFLEMGLLMVCSLLLHWWLSRQHRQHRLQNRHFFHPNTKFQNLHPRHRP